MIKRELSEKMSENKIWEDYMKRKERNGYELLDLIKNEKIRIYFKKRALDSLLAIDYILGHMTHWHWRNILNEELAIDVVYSLLNTHLPKVEGKKGNSLWAEYNQLIMVLIPLVPPKEAELLFDRFQFQIKDTSSPWMTDDIVYSSSPLELFLEDKWISEVWKRKAAEKMHGIISRELISEPNRGEISGDAFTFYSKILSRIVTCEDMPVSKEFFCKEIYFMLEITGSSPTSPILNTYAASKVINSDMIQDKDLRQRFVTRQVFSAGFVCYRGSNKAAQKIMKEFSDDKELVIYLKKQIKNYREEEAILNRKKREEEQAEKKLIEKMQI